MEGEAVGGELLGWGYNTHGQLGYGRRAGLWEAAPAPLDTDVVRLSAGVHHRAAVKADGSLWTWGENSCGQLGDGTTTGRDSAVLVAGMEAGVADVAVGRMHTVILKTDGSVGVILGGTTAATTAGVTELSPYDRTTYQVTVTGMVAAGTVVVEVQEGAANDAAGNPNGASTSTDNEVYYTHDQEPPGTVTLLGPKYSIQGTRPTLEWAAAYGALWYQVCIETEDGERVYVWTQETRLVSALSWAPGAYTFYVMAWGAGGVGPWSDGMSFTIRHQRPATPTDLLPSGGAVLEDNLPGFSWQSDADWYYFYLTKDGAVYRQFWTQDAYVAHWQILLQEGSYAWWVRPWSEYYGHGEWSDAATFVVTRTPAPPGQPSLTAPPATVFGAAPRLSWTETEGDTQWRWIVVHKDERLWLEHWLPADTSEWTPWIAFEPGAYTVWVRGWNEVYHDGPWSEPHSFTVE